MIPCDFRTKENRTIEHGCCSSKRTWQVYECLKNGECVISPLTQSAALKNGTLPACVFCEDRQFQGEVVPIGISPDLIEKHESKTVPFLRPDHQSTGRVRKKHFDKIAKKLGISPIDNVCPDRFKNYQVRDVPGDLLNSVKAFNCSIARHGDQNYLAFRCGMKRSKIMLVRTDESWQPIEQPQQLEIPLSDLNLTSEEDPRLWVLNGKLHVSFTGYNHPLSRCRIGIAEISNGQASQVFWPKIESPQQWEKNWMFFAQDDWGAGIGDNLYFIHSSKPFRVFRLAYPRGEAQIVANRDWRPPYRFGVIRGGTPPVFHRGEWYHWFHSVMHAGGFKIYSLGVYTFTTDMQISRCCVRPLYIPSPEEKLPGVTPNLLCCFPGGAVLRDGGNRWDISMGIDDRICRIVSYNASDIENELVPVN